MRKTVTVLVLAAASFALSGTNGYEADALFTTADVEGLSAWSGIDVAFGFLGHGNVAQEEITVNSAGEIFLYVYGSDGSAEFNGIVRYDPDSDTLDTIVQEEYFLLGDGTWYDNIECLTVSPSGSGPLTADHLVVVRNRYVSGGFHLEVVSIDPDTTDETALFDASGGGKGMTNLVVDPASGDVYLLEGRAGSATWGAIRRFRWNGSAYDESVVVSAGEVQWGLAIGPDGYLYSFDDSTTWPETILRIDPSQTDSWTTYATFENSKFGDNRFKGWAWDSNGVFRIAMLDTKRNRNGSDLFSYVTDVPAGGTVSKTDRITESQGAVTDAMTTGPSGTVYVVERVVGESVQTVYAVNPPSGGGGGGGKGGGKGKNR
ncbi:MAG: hypothetical protein ACYTG3_13065 [Planctomycetota bacterium]|jgi:hypothetical protein